MLFRTTTANTAGGHHRPAGHHHHSSSSHKRLHSVIMRPTSTILRPVQPQSRQSSSRPRLQNHQGHGPPAGRRQRRYDWFVQNQLGTPVHPRCLGPPEFLNQRSPSGTPQQPRLPPGNPVVKPNYATPQQPRLPPGNPVVKPNYATSQQPRLPPSNPVVKLDYEQQTQPQLSPNGNNSAVTPILEPNSEPRPSPCHNGDDPAVELNELPTSQNDTPPTIQCENAPTETIDFQISSSTTPNDNTNTSSMNDPDDIAQPEVRIPSSSPSHIPALLDINLSSFENQPFPSPPPPPLIEIPPPAPIPPQTVPTQKTSHTPLTGPWNQPKRAKSSSPPPLPRSRRRPLVTSDTEGDHPYWKRSKVNRTITDTKSKTNETESKHPYWKRCKTNKTIRCTNSKIK